MSEAHHLAESLDSFFTASDHGWFTPFTVATEGLTASQAAIVLESHFNSVWGLVNHIRFCQEAELLLLQGKPVDWQAGNDGWPPPEPIIDEKSWQTARKQALITNQTLAAYIQTLTDAELDQPIEGGAKRWQVIQGVINHNSYHICEIISVRHMQGLWLEKT